MRRQPGDTPQRAGIAAITGVRLALAAGASSTVALLAWRRGSLSPSGALGAEAVGGLTYLAGGIRWSAVLLAFFVSSSALSRLETRSSAGPAIAAMTERGSRRDAVQVFANGGVATLAAALYVLAPSASLAAAFSGALAAAAADTWATEVGGLARHAPRDLVTGQVVPPGTSGGVTPIGMGGSVAGSVLIGAAASCGQRTVAPVQRAVIVTLAGLTGALVDSGVGGTLQAGYYCPSCQKATEQRIHRCGTPAVRVRGASWCTNDMVNVLCTAAGALLAWSLTALSGEQEA